MEPLPVRATIAMTFLCMAVLWLLGLWCEAGA